MKGFHPTPADIVDRMVDKLFEHRRPSPSDYVLDPGCGHGAFIDGILRWCERHRGKCPTIVGAESNPEFVAFLKDKYARHGQVQIQQMDFLRLADRRYQYVIGNPPYVPITGLSETEKTDYRARFRTAHGRFDLYFLFFEQALKCMQPGARLVFITPEKFLYVDSAKPLRQLMCSHNVRRIELVCEDTFPGLVTYPAITIIDAGGSEQQTTIALRDHSQRRFRPAPAGESWMPLIWGNRAESPFTLESICTRVSAGIATGADDVFVRRRKDVTRPLQAFAYRTIAGRQIGQRGINADDERVMLVPYSKDGKLLGTGEMGALLRYLDDEPLRSKLLQRTCVTRKKSPKPWYAFHETPRLSQILRPKILCKDISPTPFFVADSTGAYVPRHSVYYIVPQSPELIEPLLTFLQSETCALWLNNNCQRAANGFLRIQSNVLKRLPIPDQLGEQSLELRDAESLSLFSAQLVSPSQVM